jgi:NADPH:quinone reductase
MKAAWYERFGQAQDVLETGDRPMPVAGPGEVLVRLKTSGVNPSDVKKRAGSIPDLLSQGYVIPHSDGAGVIESVGTGVQQVRVGQAVWLYQAQFGRRFGTAAEYVAIDAARAIPLPANTSFEQAACFGIPLMTAHRCVFADGPIKGQALLITGGAGRVGHYAIQWAARSGARVIATASNPADAQSCLEAGAQAVVNHCDGHWAEQVLVANEGSRVDRVIDVQFGANLSEVLDMIRTGGTIATYSSTVVAEPKIPFYRMMYMDLCIRLVVVYSMPESAKQDAINDISAWQEAGRLQHRVAHLVPMAEISRAHELVEQGGFRGCVVIRTE